MESQIPFEVLLSILTCIGLVWADYDTTHFSTSTISSRNETTPSSTTILFTSSYISTDQSSQFVQSSKSTPPEEQGSVENCMNCEEGEECCGNVYCYHTNSSICCNGQVTIRPIQRAWCCGHKAYDPETQQCCGGSVVERSPSPSPTFCCGQLAYNPDTHQCCSHQHIVELDAMCCDNSSSIDQSTQLCCFGQLNQKCGQQSACCGPLCYDPAHELCCDDKPVEICAGQWSACCGHLCYNTTSQTCVLLSE